MTHYENAVYRSICGVYKLLAGSFPFLAPHIHLNNCSRSFMLICLLNLIASSTTVYCKLTCVTINMQLILRLVVPGAAIFKLPVSAWLPDQEQTSISIKQWPLHLLQGKNNSVFYCSRNSVTSGVFCVSFGCFGHSYKIRINTFFSKFQSPQNSADKLFTYVWN